MGLNVVYPSDRILVGTVAFDGACYGRTLVKRDRDGLKRGDCSGGAVLWIDGVEVDAVSRQLERPGTSNEAEYWALTIALNLAMTYGIEYLEVWGDSRLVINQMNGRWRVKKSWLKDMHLEAVSLARNFREVEYLWHSRETQMAQRADEVAEEALPSCVARVF
jgi:ribonuclease HI